MGPVQDSKVPVEVAYTIAEAGASPANPFGNGKVKDALHLIRMVREGLNYPQFY